jgi:hypothetical protein
LTNVALLNPPVKRFHVRIADKNVGMPPPQDYPTIAPASIMPALNAAPPPQLTPRGLRGQATTDTDIH